jgi:hypothetical protein
MYARHCVGDTLSSGFTCAEQYTRALTSRHCFGDSEVIVFVFSDCARLSTTYNRKCTRVAFVSYLTVACKYCDTFTQRTLLVNSNTRGSALARNVFRSIKAPTHAQVLTLSYFCAHYTSYVAHVRARECVRATRRGLTVRVTLYAAIIFY